jgi:hypothetical protein
MEHDAAIEVLWRQHFANWSITGKGIPADVLARRLRAGWPGVSVKLVLDQLDERLRQVMREHRRGARAY